MISRRALLTGLLAAPVASAVAGELGRVVESGGGLQAALDAAPRNATRRGLVVIPHGTLLKVPGFTVPPGVELRFDGAFIEVGDPGAIRIGDRSRLIGRGGRIFSERPIHGPFIRRAAPAKVVYAAELAGFEIVGTGKASSGVDISGFYSCRVDLDTLSGLDTAIIEGGSLQTYHNDLHLRVNNCHRALLSEGELFNGNHITLHRCNVGVEGIRLTGTSAGTVITLSYIEGDYSGSGIVLDGARGTTIVGGVIEVGPSGGGPAIRLLGDTRNTTILGTRFGGRGDGAMKRISAAATVRATSYVGPHAAFTRHDGAITRVD